MLELTMARNSVCTEKECYQRLIFVNSTKISLFGCVGYKTTHVRTEAMTNNDKN